VDVSGNVSIDFDTNHIGADDATLSLTTDGSTSTITVTTGGTDAFTSASITTAGSGDSSASAITIDLTNHTTLTFAGTSDLELLSTNGFTELTSIAGGSAIGGLTIDLDDNAKAYTITLGSGDDSVVADTANAGTGGRTISLGAGDDTLDLAALAPESDDVFTGGDGVDTLRSTDTSNLTAARTTGVSGFERITLTEATTFDMSTFRQSFSHYHSCRLNY
jgi:hypothetical protein